jgi:Phage tail sheath protein subtilisin-like domain/Phage tail sheath C-terminal domain
MAFQVSPGVNVTEIDLTTIVPGISTTTGAIAGVFKWGPVGDRVLITNETNLVNTFGKPSANNYETFFTAANFLTYSNALYVVRAANTTNATASVGAMNAVANTNTITVLNNVVKNRTDYLSVRDGNTSSNAVFIAKYPGDLGNSLRISLCSSVNAFSSNLALYGNTNSNTVTGSFTLSVGSNTGTFTFVSDGVVAAANTYANTIANSITVGDLITIGNTSIGTQYIAVTNVGIVTANASVSTFNLSFDSVYKLSTDFVANSTTNGNTTSINVTRSWQYANRVAQAPSTSAYVASFGNSAAVDTLHAVVVDQDGLFTGTPGAVLEVFQNLSRATDAKSQNGASLYYKTVINDTSAYVWWANDRSGASSNTALNIASSTNSTPLTLDFAGGTDGYTESTVPVSVLATGYDLFNSTEQVDVSLVLQGKPLGGSTTVNGQAVNNFQLANYIIQNICETRKDCIAFISPDDATARSNPGNEATSIVNWFGAVADSTYYVSDSSYKYMYDRYNDVYRYVPLNGDIAGLCARTEATNDAWWSPAGFNRGQIKNIVKLRYNPTIAYRDLLYKNSVNPVVTFPGQGTVLFGDKTGTKKPSAFDRINVRRLFITLERAIASASRFSLFEFNDEFTRSQFRNLVIPYLRDVQARRGITDFLVVCDASNNTGERIDRNEFWGDIYIKPNRSINFIQLNFVAVRTGVQFSTIIGQF